MNIASKFESTRKLSQETCWGATGHVGVKAGDYDEQHGGSGSGDSSNEKEWVLEFVQPWTCKWGTHLLSKGKATLSYISAWAIKTLKD